MSTFASYGSTVVTVAMLESMLIPPDFENEIIWRQPISELILYLYESAKSRSRYTQRPITPVELAKVEIQENEIVFSVRIGGAPAEVRHSKREVLAFHHIVGEIGGVDYPGRGGTDEAVVDWYLYS